MIDRTGAEPEPEITPENVFALQFEPEPGAPSAADIERQVAAVRRVMPLPTARERRLALRLRASELVGLMEATSGADPEGAAARDGLTSELATIARSAATTADEARAQGLDPLTFRTIALDDGAGANLLQVAPLPGRHSYSSLRMYDNCPLQYAFGYVYRMPAARGAGRGVHVRFDRARRVRDVHPRASRARGPRRAAADARGPRGRVPGQLDPDRLRRQGDRGGLPAARHEPARQLLDRRGQQPVRGAPRGARLRADARAGRRHAARHHHRPDRPHRPPAVGRHRGPRLQDRPRLGPEGRRREPPALDLRARLPRRAGAGHARAGHAVLHGECAAAVDDPDGRAAGPRAGGCARAGVADARRRVRGDAVGEGVPVLRLAGDVSGAGVNWRPMRTVEEEIALIATAPSRAVCEDTIGTATLAVTGRKEDDLS